MACEFRVKAIDPVSDVVRAISCECERNGLQFRGDEDSGTIRGKGVHASYSVSGDIVLIKVHKKPFFISCGMIESEVKSKSRDFGIRFLGRM